MRNTGLSGVWRTFYRGTGSSSPGPWSLFRAKGHPERRTVSRGSALLSKSEGPLPDGEIDEFMECLDKAKRTGTINVDIVISELIGIIEGGENGTQNNLVEFVQQAENLTRTLSKLRTLVEAIRDVLATGKGKEEKEEVERIIRQTISSLEETEQRFRTFVQELEAKLNSVDEPVDDIKEMVEALKSVFSQVVEQQKRFLQKTRRKLK
jgi:archaellum component FlaC